MRRTTLCAATAAVVCGLTLLGGCSGDDDPGSTTDDPATSASGSSGSATPTEATEPSVEPASGPVIDSEGATLNAPEGWKLDPVTLPDTISAEDPRAQLQTVTVIDLESSSTPPGLDEQVRSARANFPGVKLERLPDVMLDGSPAYHLSGTVPGRGPYDEIATYAHGRSMLVNFMLNGVPDAERAEIVDSVVASFAWKG